MLSKFLIFEKKILLIFIYLFIDKTSGENLKIVF
jgi:hypothetical protein